MSGSSPISICGCGTREVLEPQRKQTHLEPSKQSPTKKRQMRRNKEKECPPAAAEQPSEDICCCCSLRVGCIVISVLFVIVAAVTLLVCILLHPAKEEFHEIDKQRVALAYKVFAILAAIKIILSVLLLLGILGKRTDLLRPWLISYFILCPIEGTALVAAMFLSFMFDYWVAGGLLLFFFVVYIALYGFCLYAVYNYFHSMTNITIIDV